MKKEHFTNKKTAPFQKKVRFYVRESDGYKFALVAAIKGEPNDWFYQWDTRGQYKGVLPCRADKVAVQFAKFEIDKAEFLA